MDICLFARADTESRCCVVRVEDIHHLPKGACTVTGFWEVGFVAHNSSAVMAHYKTFNHFYAVLHITIRSKSFVIKATRKEGYQFLDALLPAREQEHEGRTASHRAVR